MVVVIVKEHYVSARENTVTFLHSISILLSLLGNVTW